jgi:hypothetical protein
LGCVKESFAVELSKVAKELAREFEDLSRLKERSQAGTESVPSLAHR